MWGHKIARSGAPQPGHGTSAGSQGDTRDKDTLRARAIGILATPALALSMLGVHTRRGCDPTQPDPPVITPEMATRALPVTHAYVHLYSASLARGLGVARAEKIGPVLVSQLSRVLGHSQIRLTPVLHVGYTDPGVDSYHIPQRLRDQVFLRDQWEVFPFSSREARTLDLDHTIPFEPDKDKQTRFDNLGPLTRRAHRAKTHGDFTLIQHQPGIFWWRTRLGQILRVGPDGTTDYGTAGSP